VAEALSDIGASIAAKAAARVKARTAGSPVPAPAPKAAPAPAEAPAPTDDPEPVEATETPATEQPEGETRPATVDELQKLVDDGHEDQVMAILGIKVGAARARRAKRKEAEADRKLADAEQKAQRVTQQASEIRRQYTPYALVHSAINEERWADVANGFSALLPQGMSWSQFVAAVGEQGAATGGEAALQRRVAALASELQALKAGKPAAETPTEKKPKVVIGEALKAHAVAKVPDWQDLVRAEMRRHKKPEGGFKITLVKAADNVLARHRRTEAPAQQKPRVRDMGGKFSSPAPETGERKADINSIYEKAKLRAKRAQVGARR
jgi:hypothetical protein